MGHLFSCTQHHEHSNLRECTHTFVHAYTCVHTKTILTNEIQKDKLILKFNIIVNVLFK